MLKYTTITLITEVPGAHGVFDFIQTTERTVRCTEKSISLELRSQANSAGLNPSLRIRLEHDFAYKGERLARYKGEQYKVINVYPLEKSNGVDILLQKVGGIEDV